MINHLTKKEIQTFLSYQGTATSRLAIILIWQAIANAKFFAQYLLETQNSRKSFDAGTLFETALNHTLINEIEDTQIKQLASKAYDVFHCCRDWICIYEYTGGVSTSDCIMQFEIACAIEKKLLAYVRAHPTALENLEK